MNYCGRHLLINLQISANKSDVSAVEITGKVMDPGNLEPLCIKGQTNGVKRKVFIKDKSDYMTSKYW